MANLRMHASSLIVSLSIAISAQAGCLDWLLKPADELTVASERVKQRVNDFGPGDAIKLEYRGGQIEGFVVGNSNSEMVIATESGELKHFDEDQIKSLIKKETTEPFPYPQELEKLKALQHERRATANLNPVEVWKKINSKLGREIESLRAMPEGERTRYVRHEGELILRELMKKSDSKKIGFHYNLHGGSVNAFSDGGGIFISRGDIELGFGKGDPAYKVYFFSSDHFSLYDVLNESNPGSFGTKSRMGFSLVSFKADSPYFKQAFAEGGALAPSPISYDFSEAWVNKQFISKLSRRLVGVPASEYLAPPTMVFTNLKSRVGMGSLSRDEETLATMRYLEELWQTY